MSAQLLTTFLLFAACAIHFAASNDINYAQTSNNANGTCIKWDCTDINDNGTRTCKRSAIGGNGEAYNATFKMIRSEDLNENTFVMTNSNGEPCGTFQEVKEDGVTKMIIKNRKEEDVRVGCGTKGKVPTNDEKVTVNKLCPIEDDMKPLDNKNC